MGLGGWHMACGNLILPTYHGISCLPPTRLPFPLCLYPIPISDIPNLKLHYLGRTLPLFPLIPKTVGGNIHFELSTKFSKPSRTFLQGGGVGNLGGVILEVEVQSRNTDEWQGDFPYHSETIKPPPTCLIPYYRQGWGN